MYLLRFIFSQAALLCGCKYRTHVRSGLVPCCDFTTVLLGLFEVCLPDDDRFG